MVRFMIVVEPLPWDLRGIVEETVRARFQMEMVSVSGISAVFYNNPTDVPNRSSYPHTCPVSGYTLSFF